MTIFNDGCRFTKKKKQKAGSKWKLPKTKKKNKSPVRSTDSIVVIVFVADAEWPKMISKIRNHSGNIKKKRKTTRFKRKITILNETFILKT